MKLTLSLFSLLFLVLACSSKPEPVAIGLDGTAYFEPQRSTDQQKKLVSALQEVKGKFEKDPSEENYIWYGRREGYLLHLQKAIDIYTEGLARYPDSYRLYRHRAHRYITIRQFDKAIEDSYKAIALMEGKPVESEPDGVPNKFGIPKSTTQFNVWYHLGLAYYLKGDFNKAAEAYERCMQYSDNDDLLVGTADWLYMTYQKLGKKAEAEQLLDKINPTMSIMENMTYHKRLLMYKGEYQADLLLAFEEAGINREVAIATQGYGVGNWFLIQGDTAKAINIFKEVVANSSFAAFGFIAAEAELMRLKK